MANSATKKAAEKDLTVLKGNEKVCAYPLTSVSADQKRFSYTWEVLKRNFGKLVTVNLMMLCCLLPMIIVLVMRQLAVVDVGVSGIFGSNLGVGYPAAPFILGAEELALLRLDNIYFAFLLITSVFTAVGISGGIYSTQKMLRSDEEFKLKDFFIGVKENYLSTLTACALVFCALFLCVLVWNLAGYRLALDGNTVLWVFVRIVACVLFVPFLLLALWIVGIGGNYSVPALTKLKYSFQLGAPLLLPSLVCVGIMALMALPVLWLGDSMLMIFAYVWFALLAFSAMALVWSSFTDWTFDAYLDRLQGAARLQEKQAEEKRAKESGLTEEERLNMLRIGGRSVYLSRAIEPLNEGTKAYIPVGEMTAEVLAAMAENRAQIVQESAAYAEAHAAEEKYVSYNRLFDEKEKILTENKKGKKKFASKPLY